MKIECRYCAAIIDSSDEKCPHCGATNKDFIRTAVGQPCTIEELARWYKEHNLPPYEVTRFFIGMDRHESRCFGIFKKPDGNILVYKNKDDGTRAVRYDGPDETYAVNEFYQRLKTEIANQKSRNIAAPGAPVAKKKSNNIFLKVIIGYIAVAFGVQLLALPVIFFSTLFAKPSSNNRSSEPTKQITYDCDNGYYNYNDDYYYFVDNMNTWYCYDESTNYWEKTTDIDEELYENWEDYSSSSSYFSEDYEDGTTYYDQWYATDYQNYSNSSSDDGYSYSDDWDSGSSWSSSDSWDSGSTDWSSDW